MTYSLLKVHEVRKLFKNNFTRVLRFYFNCIKHKRILLIYYCVRGKLNEMRPKALFEVVRGKIKRGLILKRSMILY